MQTVADDELVFSSDLDIVTGFKLAILHMVFFHAHKGSVRIRFTITVSIPQNFLMSLVLLKKREQICEAAELLFYEKGPLPQGILTFGTPPFKDAEVDQMLCVNLFIQISILLECRRN